MQIKPAKFGLGIKGDICKQRFNGQISSKDDSIEIIGKLNLCNAQIQDILPFVNNQLAEFADKECSEIFGTINASVLAYHYKNNNLLSLKTEDLSVLAVKSMNSTLLIFGLSVNNKPSSEGLFNKIMNFVSSIAGFFGIKDLAVIVRMGQKYNIGDIANSVPILNNIALIKDTVSKYNLTTINKYDIILASKFVFENNESIFTEAMSELLGIKALDFFIASDKDASNLSALLSISNIDNSVVNIKNMKIGISINNGAPTLAMQGDFKFKCMSELDFYVNCNMSFTKFLLSAELKTDEAVSKSGKIKIMDGFYLGDTALIIGYDNGLTFGMSSSIYVGESFTLSAALVLDYQGEVIEPKLISAAISDVKLSDIVEDFTGVNSPELDEFDVSIEGFDFSLNKNFPKDKLSDKKGIVDFFNQTISDKNLLLNLDETKIAKLGNGTELIDKHRMRHYFIDNNGRLQLRAQFYLSLSPEEYNFGSYKITPGMFLCGVLKIFGVSLKIYFSLNKNEGILAFVQVSRFNFGMLSFSESLFSKNANKNNCLPEGSIVHQFINPNIVGPTLFLSAGKNGVSFYIDGAVKVAGIYKIDTRLVYTKGLISIAARFEIFNLFMCAFSVTGNFTSADNFSLQVALAVDLTGIENIFKDVTKKIEAAIEKYRAGIQKAQMAINEAKNKVNSLQSEINGLNRKIDSCKRDIRNAKWWKKAFVAIAKGAEIAAYEVAKAAVYVAIGVADAALSAASLVVKVAGTVGEGVLNAVNSIIKGVLKMFFIRKFEIGASVNKKGANFVAHIELCALGKDYTINKEISLGESKDSALKLLSGEMNNKIQPDIDSINNNTFRSNKCKFKPLNTPLSVHKQRMIDGIKNIESSKKVLECMQNEYAKEFGQEMDCSDEINVQFSSALDDVTSKLEMSQRMIDKDDINTIITSMEESINNKASIFKDGEITERNNIISSFKDVSDMNSNIINAINKISEHKLNFENNSNELKTSLKTEVPYEADNIQDKCNINTVIDKVEEVILDEFPNNKSNYYINLAKEISIFKYLDEEREKNGYQPSGETLLKRRGIHKDGYTERL